MLKYLFAKTSNSGWLDVPSEAVVFTYHRATAMRALLFGLLMAAFFEATVFHVLISLWSHWVAIAATLSSVWFAFQIAAQIRAVGLRPNYYLDGRLVLRNGAFDVTEIDVDQIEKIQLTAMDIEVPSDKLQPLKVSFPASHNVVLSLTIPTEAKILNRTKRNFQIALLAIDDPEQFAELLRPKSQVVHSELAAE